MRFTKSLLLALILSFTTLAVARDGGFSGNGADEVDPTAGAAWFLGKEPVKWCLSTSEEKDAEKIRAAFIAALKIWKSYIHSKGLESIIGGESGLAMDVAQAAHCDGTQELAIISSKSRPILDSDPTSTGLAGTLKMSYDSLTGRAKGLVWINAGILDSPVFPLVMTQQVGKILGNGPVEGTLMQVGHLESINDGKLIPAALRGRIDITRELVHSPRQHLTIVKSLTKEETLALQRVIGVGIDSKWAQIELNEGKGPQSILEGRLGVISGGSLLWVPLQFTQSLFSSKVSEQVAFKRVRGSFHEAISPIGLSYSGFATLPNGRRLPIIMTRNEDKALEIIAINSGITVELFTAKAYGTP